MRSDEWDILWDILLEIMDEYGVGPGHVGRELLAQYKRKTQNILKRRGLVKQGAGEFVTLLLWE